MVCLMKHETGEQGLEERYVCFKSNNNPRRSKKLVLYTITVSWPAVLQQIFKGKRIINNYNTPVSCVYSRTSIEDRSGSLSMLFFFFFLTYWVIAAVSLSSLRSR